MNQRAFNDLGRKVSEMGLGCWQIGADWGTVDESRALEILSAAYESGIDFFDTADVYGDGRSEKLINRFLSDRGLKGKVFVATKLGRRGDWNAADNFSYGSMAAYTERSLKNLGVERLDLMQLHTIGKHLLEDGEVFDGLRRLKQEGKIAAFGASVETMEEARICMRQPDLAALQIIFNVFRTKPIETIFDEARRKKVALIIRLPLASGLLAGKMTPSTTFDESDHRNYNRDGQVFSVGETFAGLPFEKGVKAAELMRPVFEQATGQGVSMAQGALRWILDHDAVTTVIAGASRPQQARDNAAVSDLPPLGQSAHEELAAIYKREVEPHIRGPY